MSNLVSFETNVIQLVLEDKLNDDGLEDAYAAVTSNPYITWAKFTLTDDKPNKNKQRVPFMEFDNLINSGVHMPIKMASGEISEGHDFTFPIGVITHLKKFKDTIVGLAALWYSERPEDVGLIKEKFNRKEPLNLSWELAYSSTEQNDSDVTDLRGVNLKAATLVGVPAYAGRTQITAVASTEKGEKILDELEKIQTQLDQSLNENAILVEKIANLEASASEKNTELEELRNFKTDVEIAQAKIVRLEAIKNKFSEAGITRDEAYFEEKKEILLSLDDAALDFFIQETVAFSSKKEVTEEVASVKVPGFVTDKKERPNFTELAKVLRESK